MRQHNQEYFKPDIDIHKVKRIEFGILKPEDVAKMSVVKITEKVVYGPNGETKKGGLNDPAMGPINGREECTTCKGTSNQCPGHFGHIELAKPMFHVGFIEKVVRVLQCVCYKCSKLLCDESDEKFKAACHCKIGKKRFALIHEICKGIKICRTTEKKKGARDDGTYNHDGCGSKQPKRYTIKEKLSIEVEFEEEVEVGQDRKRLLGADEVHNILKAIKAEDCEAMGFDHTPPAVRPTVMMDSTMKQEDDLTFQYRQIVRTNLDLQKSGIKGKPMHTYQESARLLQYYLATLLDNDLPGLPTSTHKSGKPLKALRARLKGKEGRIRGNLMGKRVDFSARSVITPDPSLALDQLGVPRTIAMNMTIPEVVNPLNIEFLRRLVANGPYEWPGANYIIKDNKTRLCLRDPKKLTDAHLDYGYIVERHLMDEDFVIFNRQPSLHKMSMMGHRIKILPYSSFRLNLSVTTPYNADFDGDEMNMHVPQSYETKAEIKEIMHVPRQIVSPQSNKPVMGLVQDTLCGMRLITSKDTFIEKGMLMNLLMWIENFDGKIPIPAICKPKQLWTGKQLISLILPDVNIERTSATFDDKFQFDTPINAMDSRVLIQRGRLITGGLCKRTVGNAGGGLVHIIWNDFGPDKCRRFLSTSQLVVNNWLVYNGFTVGISDTISDEKTAKEVEKILADAKEKVKETMREAQEGKLQCQAGKNMFETFENKINVDLNEARDNAGRLAKSSLSEANNVKMMVQSGSKGTDTNIVQITSCVGQQNVEGKRIPFGFRNRTLPHFNKDDYGPESKGFVQNSYLTGLTPQEFYFHAMGGREGLIDTAVKTSETGYIQRRLIKSLEDVMVKYDGTVRNSMGYVLQFLYGEDGMAGEHIEDQKITILGRSDKDMKNHYQLIDPQKNIVDELSKLKESLEPAIIEEITNNPEMQMMLQRDFEELVQLRNEIRRDVFKPNDDKQHLPVNLERLIMTAKRKFNLDNYKISDLNPCAVIEGINNLLKRLIVVRGTDRVSVEAQNNGIKLFSVHLKTELAAKKIICVEKLSKAAFNWLVGEIESRFNQSLVFPGEMVGAIAAQSIGEPATQMTLNTFHFAGVSSKNVTLGVPRLKEVINVAKTIKTPSLTIYLKPEISSDEKSAKRIQSLLEYTTLSNTAKAVQIIYDPDIKNTLIEKDAIFVKLFYDIEEDAPAEYASPWVLRIELSHDKMTDKKLEMLDIRRKIEQKYGKLLEIITSDDNDPDNLVVRIRSLKRPDSSEHGVEGDMSELKILQNSIMNELFIKGIPDIKKVYMKKEKTPSYKDNGEIEAKDKWVLETDGVNLKEAMLEEGVDHTRTYSNNIIEICQVLGIEAARKALLRELRTVLNAYGIYVNYRHLAMLADLMTHNGALTSITRHGINRVDSGPLRRCSFEETVEILLDAAVFSEVDHLKGITENIIIGQLCPLGTGYFDLLIDKSLLPQAKPITGTGTYEVVEMEREEGLSTPMQNSPNAAFTPLYRTPVYGGNTPNTPGAQTPNRGTFSPSYERFMSPAYPVSPMYDPSGGKKEKYSPQSPTHGEGGSPQYGAPMSSPSYSPEHSGYNSPPESGTPQANRQGYSPRVASLGVGFGQGRSLLSPMYSPDNDSPSNPSYTPVNPSAGGSGSYSGPSSSPRPGSGSNLQYGPSSPLYNPNSPAYYVSSPPYNPTSPVYQPSLAGPDNDELPDNAVPIGEENAPAQKEKEAAKEAKK